MSSSTLIPLAEYLNTSYRPDCDFVDGEVRERNLGESEHSILQASITAWFWNHPREWGVEVRPQQRVQVLPTRFRVPDVGVLTSNQPREAFLTAPPLICIEILSKDDTLRSLRERVNDYLDFGAEHVWILDPVLREAFVVSRSGFHPPGDGSPCGAGHGDIPAAGGDVLGAPLEYFYFRSENALSRPQGVSGQLRAALSYARAAFS